MKEVRVSLAHPGNYGSQRKAGDIQFIVIHYTGNDGDTAAANAAYFKSTVVEASAHYFVDDVEIWQSVPDLRTAWAVGGKKYANAETMGGAKFHGVVTNFNSLSVEICDTRKDGTFAATEAALQNTVELVRDLMGRYGVPIERVVRHFDVTGKQCPAYFVEEGPWAAFKARILGQDNTPAPAHAEGVEWAAEAGILKGGADGNLMLSQPLTRQQFCTMLLRFWKYIKKEIKNIVEETLKRSNLMIFCMMVMHSEFVFGACLPPVLY